MEYKHYDVELKADGDSRTIEGLGSVFGNVDDGNDMVLPGAFAKSIGSRKPVMLWQHKMDQPIGIWDDVGESAQGLALKGRILDTSLGNDAYTLVKAGALNGLSIGYGVKDYSIDKKTGTRMLKELDLFEVSLVTFPMNDKATVTRVKAASEDVASAAELIEQAVALCQSLEGKNTPEALADLMQTMQKAQALLEEPPEPGKSKPACERTLEKTLRDAGFSRKEAKAIVSGGYKALSTPRDADEPHLETLCNLFNQFKL